MEMDLLIEANNSYNFLLNSFKKKRNRGRLVQSVERLTAERDVASSIPRAGPVLRVLK